MPTSGTTAFSNTARDIARQAMIELAIPGAGGDITADELEDIIFRMNTLLKSWEQRKLSLWRETGGTVTVTANEASGTLPVNVRDVVSASVVTGSNERPLTKMARGEYDDIPNKTLSGNPSLFSVSRQRDAVTLYVWPVPTANTSLSVIYDRHVETVTDGTETVDFPAEYTDVLVTNLAIRIASLFQAPITVELAQRASFLEQQMLDDDREESYMLGAY